MRILPPPAQGDEKESSSEPYIGVESGGLQSAESLLLARYFMFSQVYFHPVRRIYDIHLKDFLLGWLQDGHYPTETDQFCGHTDVEVIFAMRQAVRNTGSPVRIHAERIMNRNHFRVLPEGSSNDFAAFGGTMKAQKIAEAAAKEFGEDNIRFDSYPPKGSTVDFPVRERDGSIVSAQSKSQVLQRTPASAFDYVFVDKEILPKVKV